MAAPNIDYTLSIKVGKDVADLVANDEYTPVVEILQDTQNVKLTNDERIEWVEVNKNTPSFPVVTNNSKEGGDPVFVQPDGDGSAGQFDVKFSGPKPDTKEIWFAIQTNPLLGLDIDDANGAENPDNTQNPQSAEGQDNADDVDDEDDTGYIDAVQLTPDDCGKVFFIDVDGELEEIDVGDDHHGVRKGNSIGFINETRATLNFWILPKDSEQPNLNMPHQSFEWLPGSGRIQLPAIAGKGLKVKVWLEAFSDDLDALGGITFRHQSQKKMVIYEDSATDAEAEISNLGLWLEDDLPVTVTTKLPTRRALAKTTHHHKHHHAAKHPAKHVSKTPPTLSSKASAKKKLVSNGMRNGRA